MKYYPEARAIAIPGPRRLPPWILAALLTIGAAIGLLLLSTALGFGQTLGVQPGLANASQNMEILSRGPVHEAFAEPVTFDPQPGALIADSPPESIEELPPDHKPEGANVAWIPGYWAWDDERTDFLWISGTWRVLPPGRQWVPGYWGQSTAGFQWTSGFWADAALTEVEYLPEPPASVEMGPNVAAPSADYMWLPGCWIWQQNRYAWRPGFWSIVQPNWSWIPAHYLWAPRGYVFVDGYWDYTVARRGVLFAPVSISQSAYTQRDFSYTPSTVIDLGAFVNHLFVRPSYGHYYFGDYYGANYRADGFHSSRAFGSSRHGYEPFYSQQRWEHRHDGEWDRRAEEQFQYRRDHEDARPPRTIAAQQELLRKGRAELEQGRILAQPLDQVRRALDGGLRFQSVTDDDRLRYGQQGQELRTHREERQRLETRAARAAEDASTRAMQSERFKFSRSPLIGKRTDELGKDESPPTAYKFPQVDPRVVPNPRTPDNRQPLRTNPQALDSGLGTAPIPRGVPMATPQVGPFQPPGVLPIPKVGPPQRPDAAPMPKVGPPQQSGVAPMPEVGPPQQPGVAPMPAVGPPQQPGVAPMPKVGPQPNPHVSPKPSPKGGPKSKGEPSKQPGGGQKPKKPK